jgi:ribosome maturation factor RimP
MQPTKPGTKTEAQESKAGVDLPRVRAAVAPVLSAHGVSLVDLAWQTDRVGWVLRITIEREGSTELGGGVTLADCAEVSRDTSAVLDADDELVPHHYNLEVSSPGVDRPLRTAADFVRFSGRSARVKLRRPAPDGQRVLRGALEEAPEGTVAVRADGKRIEVPFADVAEANLVFELNPEPKKGHPKKSATAGKPGGRAGLAGRPAERDVRAARGARESAPSKTKSP